MVTYGISEPLSLAEPTETDLKQSEALRNYLRLRGMYESQEEAGHREDVLGKLDRVIQEWVREASMAHGLVEPMLSEVRVWDPSL